jgi:hypothetical protein
MSNTRAAHLRERARHLRHLARTIETTPAMYLEVLAGDDTWRGHRPRLCRDLLERNLAQLHRAADDLLWNAHLIEQQAIACDILPAR